VINNIWKRQSASAFVRTAYYRATFSFNEFLSLRELPAFAQPKVVTHANGMLNFAIINASGKEEALAMAIKLSKEWNSTSFLSKF
jgi:hypothetical protein